MCFFILAYAIESVLLTLQEIMVYFTRKLNQKLVILTFGQFDHLVILNKSI
jgi:hypothetical protein